MKKIEYDYELGKIVLYNYLPFGFRTWKQYYQCLVRENLIDSDTETIEYKKYIENYPSSIYPIKETYPNHIELDKIFGFPITKRLFPQLDIIFEFRVKVDFIKARIFDEIGQFLTVNDLSNFRNVWYNNPYKGDDFNLINKLDNFVL